MIKHAQSVQGATIHCICIVQLLETGDMNPVLIYNKRTSRRHDYQRNITTDCTD